MVGCAGFVPKIKWHGTASVELISESGRILFDPFVPLKGSSVPVNIDDFDGFIDMIKTEMPYHEHLPTRVELQRLVVQSFAKPVNSWKPGNAPVTGKRYNDYLKIAQKMMELLGV